MPPVRISLAYGENPRSQPILDGRAQPEGIEFLSSRNSMQELVWRQLRAHEFEFSELSMSSLIAARSRGDESYIGIPIFTTRSFMQTNVLVREDAGIDEPSQLTGKRIGVPEYQQTAALWARGILQHEFGVDPMSCHWYMERLPEQSHGGATGMHLPEGLDLHYIPWTSSINEMLIAGQLDASLLGGGFAMAPEESGRYRVVVNQQRGPRIEPGSGIRRLFPDRSAEGARYYQKTGIFPVNHGAAIRKDIIDQYPWAAMSIYRAFLEAKHIWESELLEDLEPLSDSGLLKTRAADVTHTDLFPYGVRANASLLETLTQYSFEQGLSERQLELEEIFYPPTLEL